MAFCVYTLETWSINIDNKMVLFYYDVMTMNEIQYVCPANTKTLTKQ